jgi:hypothetical protein
VFTLFSAIAIVPIQGVRRHFDYREHFAQGPWLQMPGQMGRFEHCRQVIEYIAL